MASRVLGDFKLRKTLRELHKTLENKIKPAMELGTERILSDMKDFIPIDSGDGRDALTAFVAKSGLDAEVGLRGKKKRTKFFYLGFIEYGTKGVSGERRNNGSPRNRSNKTDGKSFFGKYPDIPARPAHPFVRPALDRNREYMVGLLRGAISETLKQAGRE